MWKFLVLVCALLGCVAPSHLASQRTPRSPAPPVEVVFHLRDSFTQERQAQAIDSLTHTRFPGVVIRAHVGGRYSNPGEIPIRRVHFQRCMLAGLWVREFREIWIDPDCTPGETVWRHVVLHEAGHALGMHHVCRGDWERASGCSPVGYHPRSLMNPTFFVPAVDSTNFRDYPALELSAIDRLELARALRTRNRIPR